MDVSFLNIVVVVAALIALAWFIKGELEKLVRSVESLGGRVQEMNRRIEDVQKAAAASHRRLDAIDKDIVKIKVLQSGLH